MSESEKELLEEMLKWMKFMALQDAKEVIKKSLSFEDNEKERDARIAYELTDGENSTRTIARYVSVSHVTVGNWQDKWSKLGIVEKTAGEYSPYRHLISLEEAGLECPDIPAVDDDDDTDSVPEDGEPAAEDNVSEVEQEAGAKQVELGDEVEVD